MCKIADLEDNMKIEQFKNFEKFKKVKSENQQFLIKVYKNGIFQEKIKLENL